MSYVNLSQDDQWPQDSFLSNPPDVPSTDRPVEIDKFMEQFDSVEHARKLDQALQAIISPVKNLPEIIELDSQGEDTIRIDDHNMIKKT